MEWIIIILQGVSLLGIACIFLLRKYLFSYSSEKGKNLATKEDVADITREVESVKGEYREKLEKLSNDIWREQREYEWYKEEGKIKIDILERSAYLIARFDDEVVKNNVYNSSRDIAFSISQLPIDASSKEFYRSEYSNFRAKVDNSYTNVQTLSAEMARQSILLRAYLSDDLANLLIEIRNRGNSAAGVTIGKEQMAVIAHDEYNVSKDVERVKEKLFQTFDLEWSKYRPSSEIRKFHEKMLATIRSLSGDNKALQRTSR